MGERTFSQRDGSYSKELLAQASVNLESREAQVNDPIACLFNIVIRN